MSQPKPGDATGVAIHLKKLKLAEDGSPSIEEELPLVITTFRDPKVKGHGLVPNVISDKNAKHYGRKAKQLVTKIENKSIISSKQLILPERTRNEAPSTFKWVEPKPKYDGFVEASATKSKLTIMAPPTNPPQKAEYAFMWKRGKLVISKVSGLTDRNTKVEPPSVYVWTYKGFNKKKTVANSDLTASDASFDKLDAHQISNEEYVFCGEGSTLKNCFIRFEDFRDRLNGDTSILNTAECFPIWNADGTRVQKNAFIDNYVASNTTGRFWITSHLFAGVQTRPYAPYDVMARFWDAKVVLTETITFRMEFRTNVSQILKKRFPSISNPETGIPTKIKQIIQQTLDSSKLSYQPSSENFKVMFVNEFTGFADNFWHLVGKHPNDLYRLYMSRKDFGKLINASKEGLYKPILKYKFDDIKEMHDMFHTQVAKITTLSEERKGNQTAMTIEGQVLTKTKKEGRGTTTYVTKNRVEAAAGIKRHIDQKTVMAGNSANSLMDALFERHKDEPVRRAEWLHRSARAYGGLDWEPLETTQTVENLILGTVETNTAMLRHEMFIKRYVFNAQVPANSENKEVIMEVTTRLLHGLGKKDLFNRNNRSLWFSRFLLYKYHVQNKDATPACDQTVVFHPFARLTPMRLEVLLDNALEKLIYGWGEVDVHETMVEDDNDNDLGDDEGAVDAIEEEKGTDVQIHIEVEDMWNDDDQAEQNATELPLDEVEVVIEIDETEDLKLKS